MSKENNLKDYLTDLYDGISSKKPGASRNPQNFRAEIEAIKTGGIPWDGDYTIEGDALPEPPKVYHLTSADELPDDAVDGSVAVVEVEDEQGVLGTWVFKEMQYQDFLPKTDYYVIFRSYDYLYAAIEVYADYDNDHFEVFYSIEAGDYSEPVWGNGKWAEEPFRTITVLRTWNSDFEDWLKRVATHIAPLYTIYSRENGVWVNRGEM